MKTQSDGYVASDDTGLMTDEVLVIDGGWTAFGYY